MTIPPTYIPETTSSPPTGHPAHASVRLLDDAGEPLAGYPVSMFITSEEDSESIVTSLLRIYDPFTGIYAGPGEELGQLKILTSHDGFAPVLIDSPPMTLGGKVVDSWQGLAMDFEYDIHADPYPSVGLLDLDSGLWIEADPIYTEQVGVSRVPTAVGEFNRFELSGPALPGKIEVETTSGRPLEEFSPGGARIGQTFRRNDLPQGFFIYDPVSESLMVSDESVETINVKYQEPPFTLKNTPLLKPRRLEPNPNLTVDGTDLASTKVGLYPDIKLYLQAVHGEIRRTALLVFQNPLSKLEESRRYSEG